MQADILPSHQDTNIHAHQDRMYGGGGGCWESPSQTLPPKAVEPPTKFELVLIVERIELFCVGLCLDCLKGNKTCRAEHTDPFSEHLWIPLRNMSLDGGPDYGTDTMRPVDWQSIW